MIRKAAACFPKVHMHWRVLVESKRRYRDFTSDVMESTFTLLQNHHACATLMKNNVLKPLRGYFVKFWHLDPPSPCCKIFPFLVAFSLINLKATSDWAIQAICVSEWISVAIINRKMSPKSKSAECCPSVFILEKHAWYFIMTVTHFFWGWLLIAVRCGCTPKFWRAVWHVLNDLQQAIF